MCLFLVKRRGRIRQDGEGGANAVDGVSGGGRCVHEHFRHRPPSPDTKVDEGADADSPTPLRRLAYSQRQNIFITFSLPYCIVAIFIRKNHKSMSVVFRTYILYQLYVWKSKLH